MSLVAPLAISSRFNIAAPICGYGGVGAATM
jgi:hypothetical protein